MRGPAASRVTPTPVVAARAFTSSLRFCLADRKDAARGAILKCQLHKRAVKAGLCAGAVDRSGNDKCGKQHKECRAEDDPDKTVGYYRTTLTHTGPHDQGAKSFRRAAVDPCRLIRLHILGLAGHPKELHKTKDRNWLQIKGNFQILKMISLLF